MGTINNHYSLITRFYLLLCSVFPPCPSQNGIWGEGNITSCRARSKSKIEIRLGQKVHNNAAQVSMSRLDLI